jgi:hypothetical protein
VVSPSLLVMLQYRSLVARSVPKCRIQYFSEIRDSASTNFGEYYKRFFYFQYKFIFLKKIIFLKFWDSIFRINLCQTCYMATIVLFWIHKCIFLVDVLESSSKITMKLNFQPFRTKIKYGFFKNQLDIFELVKIQLIL